ncbi:hypothetical protein [Bradyrhizobium sp. USDA 4459]
MASRRQIEANRANATRSTGPKSPAGKAKSCRNALRHGLARALNRDDPDIARLVDAIGPELLPQGTMDQVVDVARCKLELARIRAIRQQILAAVLGDPASARAKRLTGLERYERAALARQNRALRSFIARA